MVGIKELPYGEENIKELENINIDYITIESNKSLVKKYHL